MTTFNVAKTMSLEEYHHRLIDRVKELSARVASMIRDDDKRAYWNACTELKTAKRRLTLLETKVTRGLVAVRSTE